MKNEDLPDGGQSRKVPHGLQANAICRGQGRTRYVRLLPAVMVEHRPTARALSSAGSDSCLCRLLMSPQMASGTTPNSTAVLPHTNSRHRSTRHSAVDLSAPLTLNGISKFPERPANDLRAFPRSLMHRQRELKRAWLPKLTQILLNICWIFGLHVRDRRGGYKRGSSQKRTADESSAPATCAGGHRCAVQSWSGGVRRQCPKPQGGHGRAYYLPVRANQPASFGRASGLDEQ